MIDATVLRVPSDALCGSAKQIFLAECDRAGILHGTGREVGNADDVELAERYLMPVHSL